MATSTETYILCILYHFMRGWLNVFCDLIALIVNSKRDNRFKWFVQSPLTWIL